MMFTWKPPNSPAIVQVILIVSDQADISEMWEASFQEKGFTTVCEAPENAPQTCRLIDPAITVVDTQFPHTKRLEFCLELRAATPSPIILLVPDYNGNQMIDIYNIGVDECLLKPISSAFLVVKATSWLLRRRWLDFDSNLKHAYTGI